MYTDWAKQKIIHILAGDAHLDKSPPISGQINILLPPEPMREYRRWKTLIDLQGIRPWNRMTINSFKFTIYLF